MNRLKEIITIFSIPLCALGAIIIKSIFVIKNQSRLSTQYDLYILFLILIVSSIFSFRKNTETNNKK